MTSDKATTKHPMQPIVRGPDGLPRFKQNAIIRHLVDTGALNLNALAEMAFSDEDNEQLVQLLGYTIDRFASLDFVDRETVEAAEAAAARILAN